MKEFENLKDAKEDAAKRSLTYSKKFFVYTLTATANTKPKTEWEVYDGKT